MVNILMADIKVGDIIKYGFKIIEVGRIQRGEPNGLIMGYDQYGNYCKVPFKNC